MVLEDIHDPHNAAAIMRTCDALGAHDVRLVFAEEKPWNPHRVGKASSSSANKWLSFAVYKSTQDCIDALKKEGFDSVVTVLQGESALLDTYPLIQHERIALWVGNEHRGVSLLARENAKACLKLPMRGMVESLNVSVAAALFLYELTRQWSAKENVLYTEEEAEILAEGFLAR